jgi:hypothetical protein
MSGAQFTRKIYDNYNTRINQSTAGLEYHLYPGQSINCNLVRPTDPGKLGNGVSISACRSKIDVENDLRNISRKITDNQELLYSPVNFSEPLIHFEESKHHKTFNCRVDNPASNNRENNLYDKYVFLDVTKSGMIPQYEKASKNPGKVNLDTKTLYKDNFRPELPILDSIQTNIFYEDPGSAQRNIEFCVPIKKDNLCGVFTGPLNDFVFYPNFCKY